MQRVVITGLGCVTPLGVGAGPFWAALQAGRSGIRSLPPNPAAPSQPRIIADIPDFQPAAHIDPDRLAFYDRFAQFALTAAALAVAGSGLEISGAQAGSTGVVIGTGIGGMTTLDDSFRRYYGEGHPRAHPLTIPRVMVNSAVSHVSMRHGARGPSLAVSSACASASHAVGEALWMIRNGRATAVIAGGAEAAISTGSLRAWEALRVLAPDACRPFSRDRKGMVLGEGAGIVVLEALESARARGAPILAELLGYGASSDAADIVHPALPGVTAAIAGAMRDARLNPEDVDFVSAHGTGTQANDATETQAIRAVFGGAAGRLAVSSGKSVYGHPLGAAGGLGLITAVLAIRDGVVPPTMNHREADPECDLDIVRDEARPMRVRRALVNAFAFGGLNAVLAVGPPP